MEKGTTEPLSGIELPPLPLEEWKDTKETLHRYAQIVGKVRMELSPPQNHWWHVTLYVTPRGLSTGPVPHPSGTFDLSFDLLDNRLVARTSDGEGFSFELDDLPVAEFYRGLLGGLGSLGVEVAINPKPFDLDDASTLERNTDHRVCNREHTRRFHTILTWADGVFREYAGDFVGKQSPVHLFWHSFDLAVARFSGRRVEQAPGTDPVTREAYSHEVISCGFWAGDSNIPEPAFYSYTAPEPPGLTDEPLTPKAARWLPEGGTALLTYGEVRRSERPKDTLLRFLRSAYRAGSRTANWDALDLMAARER
jgi:hypothetical protein